MVGKSPLTGTWGDANSGGDFRGNPDDQTYLGWLCSKAFCCLTMLRDPSLVNVPHRRTTSRKGIGIDPQWVEISWNEAREANLGAVPEKELARLLKPKIDMTDLYARVKE